MRRLRVRLYIIVYAPPQRLASEPAGTGRDVEYGATTHLTQLRYPYRPAPFIDIAPRPRNPTNTGITISPRACPPTHTSRRRRWGPAHAAGAYFKEEDHSTDAVVKEEGRSEGRHNLRGVEASDAVFITGYGPASMYTVYRDTVSRGPPCGGPQLAG